jgi:hypothetical protein
MGEAHRKDIEKLISHVRDLRRQVISDVTGRRGTLALGTKDLEALRNQQGCIDLLKAALADEGGT